jgi:hypothetical protein
MEANSGIPILNKSFVLKADNSVVKCGNCGWEWEFSLGGESPLVCHQCKGDLGNNSFSEARGYRRKKRSRKVRSSNAPRKRLRKRQSEPKRRTAKPTPKMRSKPNRTRRFDTSNPKLLPLPPSALNKQGSSASIEQPKNNKMLYIVGGVAVLGIVAFIIYKRK